MGTYNNICPRPPTNYSHQPPWQQHAESLNGLISLHKLAPSLISPFPNVRYALKHHMLTLPIHNHYLRAADSGAKKKGPWSRKKKRGGDKDTVKCKTRGWKQALWFDLRFPAGPELSEPLIGSCNSALIWLGQSMRCRLTSCDCAAIRREVKNPIVSSVPGNIQFRATHVSTAGQLLLCGHRELLWQSSPVSPPHFRACIDRASTKSLFGGWCNLAIEIQANGLLK